MPTHWEHFSHDADIGLRGIGPSRDEAFSQTAIALTSVVTDVETVRAKDQLSISCEAQDDEQLLVDWLNTLIYHMATSKLLFKQCNVSISHNGSFKLEALCRGEPMDRNRHKLNVEIKGATYTELSVKKDNHEWIAQTIVDV